MARHALAIFDRAIGEAPDWVHLLPMGQIKARDGRRFVLDDPEAIVAVFETGGLDLPVDYEHASEKPEAKRSGPVPAAGWIKQLQVRADGLWGRVEWTARARDMIGNREYRFLSPAILFNKEDRRVVKLKGAGLVHSPALHLTALASQEDEMAETPAFMARLAELLKLDESADEDNILQALEARLASESATASETAPDPEKFVPIDAVRDMMRDRKATATAASRDRAESKVQKALADGHIIPAMKTWALDLCMANEASFDSFVSDSAPAAYAHLHKPTHASGLPPGTGSEAKRSPEAAAICEQLGLDPATFGD